MKNQIHIAIDGNEANIPNRVGSNVYAYQVIKQLEEITRAKQNISFTILLSQPPITDMPTERPGWVYKEVTPYPFWTQIGLPIHLYFHQDTYDVYFNPGHYAARISSVPYVTSVMDVSYLIFPQQFKKRDLVQLTNWTKYSVKNAQKIIAISQSTKKDVIKHYKRKSQDIVVAYPALTENNAQPSPSVKTAFFKKHGIGKNYIFYLGTLQPRKNLLRLIEAFESTVRYFESQKSGTPIKGLGGRRTKSKQFDGLQLVIAGKIGWLADDLLHRVKSSPFVDRIVLTNYVSETEKKMLYQKALCSVLVGLYEGFGIPPLESMSHGIIPVVSKTTSLPEVVGEAGILVNPESVLSIAKGLKKAITLNAKQKALYRRKMKKQLKKFDWKETAQIILDTLMEVANAN